jgi:ankyrin repeat protein
MFAIRNLHVLSLAILFSSMINAMQNYSYLDALPKDMKIKIVAEAISDPNLKLARQTLNAIRRTSKTFKGIADKPIILNIEKGFEERQFNLNDKLYEGVIYGKEDVVKSSLDNGADANTITPFGGDRDNSALLAAADLEPDETIFRLLLSNGAKINYQNLDGKTALMKLAKHVSGKENLPKIVNIIKLLRAQGADLNLKDGKGRTALDIAKQYGVKEIIDALS